MIVDTQNYNPKTKLDSGLFESNKEFTNCTFEAIKFKDFDFEEINFENCTFEECTFYACDFENIHFNKCKMKNNDFNFVKTLDVKFNKCDLSNSSFKNSRLNELSFESCKMTGLSFMDNKTTIGKITFKDCILTLSNIVGISFKNQTLENLDFTESDICDCDFSNSIFNDCRLEKVRFKGTNSFKNADLRGCAMGEDITYPDLVSFQGAFISKDQASGILRSMDIKVL